MGRAGKAGRHIGYCHLEKLHNLEALPADGFTIACFPHKIRGASAGWTRAVAIFEEWRSLSARQPFGRADRQLRERAPGRSYKTIPAARSTNPQLQSRGHRKRNGAVNAVRFQ